LIKIYLVGFSIILLIALSDNSVATKQDVCDIADETTLFLLLSKSSVQIIPTIDCWCPGNCLCWLFFRIFQAQWLSFLFVYLV